MITAIEQGIVTRLREGLGEMVKEVNTYGGELEDIGQILRALPGLWVTFKGVTACKPVSLSRRKWRVTGDFAVFVASRSVRSEATQRVGGPGLEEPGCNLIVKSVRRLLIGQDVGLPIDCLRPGRVANLFKKTYRDGATSVYVCEFSTHWYEEGLENGHWPAPDGRNDPDYVFEQYAGRIEAAWDVHNSTHGEFTADGRVVAESTVSHLKTEDDHD